MSVSDAASRRSTVGVGWALAGAVLAVLTVAVVAVDGPLPGEVAFIVWLQGFDAPVPEFADVVRATTGTEGNLIAGIPLAIFLIARHGRRGGVAVAIMLVAMLVVQPVGKLIIDRDRPDTTQVEVRAEHSSLSYPSGHSLSTATVFGTVAIYSWRRRQRVAAAVAAVPIACTAFASGIHGVHWASDAIAGTIIGLAAATLAVDITDLSAVPTGTQSVA